jgi:hypothetical protein
LDKVEGLDQIKLDLGRMYPVLSGIPEGKVPPSVVSDVDTPSGVHRRVVDASHPSPGGSGRNLPEEPHNATKKSYRAKPASRLWNEDGKLLGDR